MTLARPISRLLAVALLFATFWILSTMVLAPLIRRVIEERQEAANNWSLLARYRQLEASLPTLQRRRDELSASAGSRIFLQGTSPALMTAELQSTAQRLVSSAGVTLRSNRTMPLSSEGGYDRVGVELDIAASTAGLNALLYAIEMAEPAVFVERLTVQVPESGAGAKTADGQPQLSIGMRLHSYARPTAAKTRAS